VIIVLAASAILLLIATITDLYKQTIPNWLTGGAFVTGLLYQGLAGEQEINGWLWSLGGAAAGFLPLLLLYALGGIGAGDVKLFGGLGAWIGAYAVANVLMYAILYAGVIGILLLLLNRPFARSMSKAVVSVLVPSGASLSNRWFSWAKSGKSFPFMLAVAPAAITVWIVF
jgi:prepilin peptidase CpaA